MDICLNAVATLFLVELDNLSFMFGLNEDVRMQVFAKGSCATHTCIYMHSTSPHLYTPYTVIYTVQQVSKGDEGTESLKVLRAWREVLAILSFCQLYIFIYEVAGSLNYLMGHWPIHGTPPNFFFFFSRVIRGDLP